jgi:hypothetical protein
MPRLFDYRAFKLGRFGTIDTIPNARTMYGDRRYWFDSWTDGGYLNLRFGDKLFIYTPRDQLERSAAA